MELSQGIGTVSIDILAVGLMIVINIKQEDERLSYAPKK